MKKTAFITSLILIFATGFVYAGNIERPREQRQHHEEQERCYRDISFLRDTLKLSEQQIERIETINSNHKNKLRKLISDKRPLQRELRTVILSEEIDLSKARSLLEQIGELETEVRMQQIIHRVEIEKILTPEQKEKYNSERQKLRQRRN